MVRISALLGVDRLYLGYSGAWGIRALVDTVRISLRNVPDSHARPRR
jgi:hypothetical protein